MLLQIDGNRIVDSIKLSWDNFLAQIPGILLAILIAAIGFFIADKIAGLSKKVIRNKTQDPLMTNFLSKTIKVILVVIILMFALRVAGLQGISQTLLTAAGASAVILGFAFRDIGENFISGIILSFNRPFNVNDTIEVGDIFGRVKSMEFRYTKVKTFDGKDVYIPNSDVLRKPLFNYTEDGFFRMDFLVGIDYEDSIEKAQKVILEATNNYEAVLTDEQHKAFVVVDSLDVSTVNLKIFFWINSEEYGKKALQIKSQVVANVKDAIMANGLNLPANIQEIKLYGTQQSIPISITKAPDNLK